MVFSIFKSNLQKQAVSRVSPVRALNLTEWKHINDFVDEEVAYDVWPHRPTLVRKNGQQRNKRLVIKEEENGR
jgi:hypothetical protein